MTFTGDVSQIPAPLDNNGSWLEVRPATTLYRDPGLGGVSQQLGAGRFPVQALSVVGNDTVSSVLVNEGVSSRLCSDDPNTTVGGTCDTFTKSALGLNASLNDTTSWVENRHTVILAPLNEQSFFGPVILRGYAASPTDGELAGAQLRWYSSVDGFLGTGKALTVHLTEATACERGIRHAITLVATDSKGVVFATTRWMFSSLIC